MAPRQNPWRRYVLVFVTIVGVGLFSLLQMIKLNDVPLYGNIYIRGKNTDMPGDNKGTQDVFPDLTQPRRVIIVTYARSGSSFLGELFNRNRNAIYWFEPLHTYVENWYRTKTYLQEHNIDFVTLEDYDSALLRLSSAAEALLKCNMSFARHKPLDETRLLAVGKLLSRNSVVGAQLLANITEGRKNIYDNKLLAPEVQATLEEECRKKDIVAFKTIRLPMADVEHMLKEDRNLFIIYLTRDPRGSALSRMKLWWRGLSYQQLVERTEEMCDAMIKDHGIFQELQRVYKERMIHVRYEDIAMQPVEYARTIYKMLGYDSIPDYLYTWILNNTSGNLTASGAGPRHNAYSTSRNSSAIVYAWKKTKRVDLLKSFGEVCAGVIEKLNYDLEI